MIEVKLGMKANAKGRRIMKRAHLHIADQRAQSAYFMGRNMHDDPYHVRRTFALGYTMHWIMIHIQERLSNEFHPELFVFGTTMPKVFGTTPIKEEK